jgi:hypothetical protein
VAADLAKRAVGRINYVVGATALQACGRLV